VQLGQAAGRAPGLETEGAILVDESVEAGAPRAAVEPEHDGVGGWVALRLHQVVEQAPLAGLVHGDVSAVEKKRGEIDDRRSPELWKAVKRPYPE
jgi:hypothetical protein